ncbi:GtrA family protein [Qaidamihabitans albus]|uniref:GtrA family protein n=1 Tax=Qaidamihabitans albus TaxID=2795733 RepID=UPI0018F1C173|nr:GtrA family protein [Qaidamihabitans albus]
MTTATAAPGTALREPLPVRRRELGRHAVYYVLAGGATTLLQALVFLMIRGPLGAHAANLVALALTTVANTEFHRLVTFAGTPAAPARRHVQAVLAFAFYAGSGSLVLVLLHGLTDTPSPLLETTALVITSAGGGLVRFVLLRSWVFARRPASTVKMAG